MNRYEAYFIFHWIKAHAWDFVSTLGGLLCTFALMYVSAKYLLSLLNH